MRVLVSFTHRMPTAVEKDGRSDLFWHLLYLESSSKDCLSVDLWDSSREHISSNNGLSSSQTDLGSNGVCFCSNSLIALDWACLEKWKMPKSANPAYLAFQVGLNKCSKYLKENKQYLNPVCPLVLTTHPLYGQYYLWIVSSPLTRLHLNPSSPISIYSTESTD